MKSVLQIARAAIAFCCLTVVASSLIAEEQAATEPYTRPGYSTLRQNDDWSFLKNVDRTQTGHWFDRIKYIPLSDDGSTWLSLGGQLRMRYENWNSFGILPAANDDDDFTFYRIMLHADLHVGENLRFFVEGKGAFSDDRELPGGDRTADVDQLALQQAFVDWQLPLKDDQSLTLRVGRQMLEFGNQRLVSPLPWSNSMRTWDGISAIYETDDCRVHAFYTQFVIVDKYDHNEPDAQTEFYGIYGTGKVPFIEQMNADVYYLGLQRGDAVTFNGTTGTEHRHTVGGRLFGKVPNTQFDYDFETAYQFGEVGSGEISAWMFAAEVGYTFNNTYAKPRVHVGFDYASGDDQPGGDVETFNQLFPLGHKYFGYIDAVGRQNVIDLSFGIKASPFKKVTVAVQQHFFWVADSNDVAYNAGGGVLLAGGSDNELGQETDVTVTYKHNENLSLLVGYSYLDWRTFAEFFGRPSDVHFFYLQTVFNF